ncbi:MAG: RdgB/HAM1 family non-canonical purine NTP pyrophosphatase [Muribaculaceae bacterium]|nr:RdgB/HAM1 family non-canonical purine NTP pyrophosphatase [Muribaculaceae bacterium]
MTKTRKLVMATNNAGKLREARAIAGDRLEILSLKDIGFDQDIEETADTLEGNALIKVRAIKDACGLDCFADDTGLMVDALGGAPGVHTARYAGDECNPDKNIDLMLKNMEGVADRNARFCTCVALSIDGEEHLFEGSVEGEIATERSGSHGFGYDPIFIPKETGVCFAEMTEEAKNAISHRGRAITAMMRWLGAICICLFSIIEAKAVVSTDWRLFNTFDDKVEKIFDTPDKTYILAQAQLYDASQVDNNEKLMFLFAIDKETDELRHYNAQNFLSRSVIKAANYNAIRNYLMIVYDDFTIDLLHDDGSVNTINALKSYVTSHSKGINYISFDPENNLAYLATDFGFMIIDDKKNEVASSGIYNEKIDKVIRLADKLLIARDGTLYEDNFGSKHLSISDFKESDLGGPGKIGDLLSLTSDRCVISRDDNGTVAHKIISFESGKETPEIFPIGRLDNADITENKDGILFGHYGSVYQLDRNATRLTSLGRREEDRNLTCGSWDFKNFYYAKPREGVYSVRHEGDNNWTVTRQISRPDAPAVFRSNNLLYTPRHGMLVNTHGINQDFSSRMARNLILLSAFKDQTWTMHGLPYLDPETQYRLSNPCGLAQDPDDPDVFYFGSTMNGLLRYNINDMSSLLHITRSDDYPDYPGHVSVQDPYSSWSNSYMLTNPVFDNNGNFWIAHLHTEVETNYYPEIWVWTPQKRKASISPETFQPFTRLKIEGMRGNVSNLILPLSYQGNQNMVVYFSLNYNNNPFVIYNHNGTLDTDSDDRQVQMDTQNLEDSDGKLECHYIYCAIEDPSTGLVWVGSDNGVFTFNPKEAFNNPNKVSRIKVSRNDGTSLADYLLSGISVNDISIDGMGRKWFSLSGGGLVCTSADGKIIIQEINNDNSLLPSDIVYATCYNPDNNSMMIATSAGLCEYYINGQAAESGSSSVRAFPNPVRHDYYGWVTIDGLEEDCIVKIADSAGNIIRELGPAGAGRVQWDVCGMDLNRVPSGVYFVLASSGPGGGSYSEVTKILVINR